MTRKQYETMTLEEMKKRKWRTCRTITTGAAKIDVGQPITITYKRGGLTISTEKCKHCGVRFFARKVGWESVEEVVKIKKLSPQQIRLLTNLKNGTPINSHCNTQSDYGGLHGTVLWARQRKYMFWKEDKITLAGLLALEAERG